MTNFLIFFTLIFSFALIILWMVLDYQFKRYKAICQQPFVIHVTGKLSDEDRKMLMAVIKNHNDKIKLEESCGYTQP